MRRFEYVEGTSSKFWEIALDGSAFTVTYGKLGAAGTTQTKSWPTDEKAKAEHDKLIKEKTGKGYVEVSNGAGEAAADDGAEAASTPAPKPRAAPKPKAAPVPLDEEGWMDAGGGYALGIRDGSVVARNDKGK